MKSLHIIYRTCAPVKKASRGGERPFNLDKRTIILKCLKSLLISCSHKKDRIFLEVVDDSSPEEFRDKMQTILDKYEIEFKINKNSFGGNGESLETCYKIAENSDHDLIYFCEDDYFHSQKSIPEIFHAYDNEILFTDNFAIHPTDYPDRYVELIPSYIFLGNSIHWRSIFSTTGTLIIPKKTFLEYKKYFFSFADFNKKSTGGEDKTINKIWENVPLISPIPSLAAHIDNNSLPHFIDWKKKIDKIKLQP